MMKAGIKNRSKDAKANSKSVSHNAPRLGRFESGVGSWFTQTASSECSFVASGLVTVPEG